MNNEFNKGLALAGFGSFWWGFVGVIYFEMVSFIGHIELVVHRCLWTAVMLIFTTSILSKWSLFKNILKVYKKQTNTIKENPNLIFLYFVLYWGVIGTHYIYFVRYDIRR